VRVLEKRQNCTSKSITAWDVLKKLRDYQVLRSDSVAIYRTSANTDYFKIFWEVTPCILKKIFSDFSTDSSSPFFIPIRPHDFEDTGRRLRLKCDGTRAEIRFRLSVKRTSPFKSVGASVYSTTGNRGVRISGSNAGYTMFRGSVKNTGYQLHSPVSLPLPCVTVCHHISTGLYYLSKGQ
jgi:hypothetical protein